MKKMAESKKGGQDDELRVEGKVNKSLLEEAVQHGKSTETELFRTNGQGREIFKFPVLGTND